MFSFKAHAQPRRTSEEKKQEGTHTHKCSKDSGGGATRDGDRRPAVA